MNEDESDCNESKLTGNLLHLNGVQAKRTIPGEWTMARWEHFINFIYIFFSAIFMVKVIVCIVCDDLVSLHLKFVVNLR